MEKKPNIFGKWPTKLSGRRGALFALLFSVLNFVLCCAFALSPSSSSLFASRQSVSAAPALTSLSDIMGYSQNGNSYNYVYFGEYPKTRVLKQILDDPTVEIGDYTPESIIEENTIKGYIKDLNETYYRNVLNQPAYMWSDDTGSTTQIQNFYPQEDFENENISFDFRSGYYTLKTAVGTYPMGSKFHTYNQTVAYYEKMGSSYVDVSNPSIIEYIVAPTTLITAGTGPRTYNYSQLSASKIYLFTVEPIKWRVLANDGSQLTLLADTILDSAYIKVWQAYQTEWAYSDARGWLNGKTTTTFSASTTPTTYTRYYEGRNFLTRAFTPEQAAAITEKQIVQDSDASFYAETYHVYNPEIRDLVAERYPQYAAVNEPTRPTTTDKIYLLSQPEIFGTYNTLERNSAGKVVNKEQPKAGSPNVSYGLKDANSRRAYNTDYSIATGNYDSALAGSNYSQNTSSGNGGLWWSRSASAYYSTYSRYVLNDGGLYYSSSSYSFGVRPAFNLSISNLASGGIASEPVGGAPAADCGTSSAPIALAQSAPTPGNNEFVLWDFAGEQSNNSTSGVKSKIISATESGGVYTNKIQVTFANIKAGTALYAHVQKAGTTLVLGAITPRLTSATNTGETFFTFTSSSAATDDDIQIYSAENYSLFTCNAIELAAYLDPTNGNDANSGMTSASPVQTLQQAYALLGGDNAEDDPIIYLMNTLSFSAGSTVGFAKHITIKRHSSNTTDLISIGGAGSFIFDNLTFDGGSIGVSSCAFGCGNTSNVTITNSNFVNNFSTNAENSGGAMHFRGNVLNIENTSFINNSASATYGGGAIYCISGAISITNSIFTNNNANNGGAIRTGGTLTITDSHFTDNQSNTSGGAIYCSSTLTITDSHFTENSASTSGGGAIYCTGNATLENSEFTLNQAKTKGGAIYCSSDLNFSVNACLFEENEITNKSTDDGGGAIYAKKNVQISEGTKFIRNHSESPAGALSIFASQSNYYITGTEFIENTSNFHSGAVFISTASTLIFEDCLFENNFIIEPNDTNGGGAIRTGYHLTLINCDFIENGNPLYGGAIYTDGNFSATDCNFIRNSATTSGGAVYSTTYNAITFTRCRFEDNIPAGQEGAIYSTKPKNLIDCVFISNVTIYFDPLSGNDANNGSTPALAVKTFTRLTTLIGSNAATVFVMNPCTISASTTVGSAGTPIVFKRHYDENDLAASNTGSLFVINGGATVTFTNATFDGVNAGVYVNGGAMNIAANCTVNLTDCTFVNNDVYIDNIGTSGGAIYSKGAMFINNCMFTENRSWAYGGAIYVESGTIEIKNDTNFINNTTRYDGAAIYFKGNNFLVEDCFFENNSVTHGTNGAGGAAIRLLENSIIKRSTFINNYTNVQNGGAIHFSGADKTLTIEDCIFEGNKTTKSNEEGAKAYGGAIYSVSTGLLTITGSTFEGNTSPTSGGAIYSTGALTITDCTFENNTATNSGGAIYTEGNMTIEDCTFTANSTTSTTGRGGAIYIASGTAEIKGETSFTENTSYQGAIICITGSSSLLSIWSGEFKNNTSYEVGSLAVYSSSKLIIYYAEMSGNKATGTCGGAIHSQNGKITIYDGLFSNNTAKYGGALSASDDSTWDIYGGTFKNNITGTTEGGGAIRINYGAKVSISNAIFEDNSAPSRYGGAIYIGSNRSSQSLSLTNCTFTGNSAISGGAIYSSNTNPLNISDCTFTGNTASTNGAAIYVSGESDLTCVGCHFEANTPRGRLGALYSLGTITLTDCTFVNDIFVNPVSGSDTNDGLSMEAPLQSLSLATTLLNGEGTIHLLKTASISASATIGTALYHIKIIRGYDGTDATTIAASNASYLFSISGSAEVHFLNVTLDGLSTYQCDVPAIRLDGTAQVHFDSDTIIQNCYRSTLNTTASGIYTAAGTKLFFGDTIVRDCDYYFLNFGGAVEINGLFAENFETFATASGSSNSFVMNRGTAINGGRFLFINNTSSISQIEIRYTLFKNLSTKTANNGGAIHIISYSNLIIENCIFESCFGGNSGQGGGAIFIRLNQYVKISNSNFYFNKSSLGSQIRIYLTPSGGEYIIEKCNFYGELNYQTCGVQIAAENLEKTYRANVSFTDCLFEDCSVAKSGSAIYVVANDLTITNCEFKNCVANSSSAKGAIYADVDGTFTMTGCEISGNIGGGVYVILNGSENSALISDCKISGNTLLGANAIGGGLYISNTEAGGTITISNTQIVGNHSAGTAGGAYFDITGPTSALTLTNCTFASNVSATAIGALGMPSTSRIGTLTIEGCTFTDNFSANQAIGALYFTTGTFTGNTFEFNQSSGADNAQNLTLNVFTKAEMNGETYFSNSAQNGRGAVFNLTFARPAAKLTAENCLFSANSTTGAASLHSPIFIEEGASATATFTNCQFLGNSGKSGGALYSWANALVLTDCTFTANFALISGGSGGAVYARNVILSNCTFSENSTLGSGGALRAFTQATIADSTFRSNSGGSGSGGGILVEGASTLSNTQIYRNSILGNGGGISLGGASSLTNCYIFENTASGDGGGIFHNSAAATLLSCMVHSNTANRGGGIFSSQTLDVQMSNVHSNAALSSSGASGGGLYLSGTAMLSAVNVYGNTGVSMGGGMVVFTNVSLTNSRLYSNSAAMGGGIAMVQSTGNIIENVEFSNNLAIFGGAIYQDSTIQPTGEVITRIKDCSFLFNTASSFGGATFTQWRTDFLSCTFIGNSAESGSVNHLSGGFVVPIGTEFYTDSSLTAFGGAILDRVKGAEANETYLTNAAGTRFFSTADLLAVENETGEVNWQKVSFTDCSFEENISLSDGMISTGATNAIFPARISIVNCEVVQNSDSSGAALSVQNHTMANVTQTHFEDNLGSTALDEDEQNGGGVSVGAFATLDMANCTFHSTISQNIVFAREGGTLKLTGPKVTAAAGVVFARGPVETQAGSTASIIGGTMTSLTSTKGGALYIGGTALVQDTDISYCIAEENGGAIFVTETGILTFNAIIRSCDVNISDSGGKGIYSLGSVTMTGGDIYNSGGSYPKGGGIYIAGGIYTMNGGSIRNNYGAKGGGIYVNTGATAVINQGTISGNWAYSASAGGGIHVSVGATLITGAGAVISNNTVHGQSTNIQGIGVYNAGTMIMNGGTISGNAHPTIASSGGGIYSAANSTLTIENALITGNKPYGDGGALFLENGCKAYIENTTISANKPYEAEGFQGAAIHSEGAQLILKDCKILENISNYSALYFVDSEVSIINCTISNNSSNYGPTLLFIGENNNLIIEGTTLKENSCLLKNEYTQGGCILIEGSNKVIINEVEVFDNDSKSTSGAYSPSSITIINTNIFEITSSKISSNLLKRVILVGDSYLCGGGLSIMGTKATQAIIKNTVIENNIGTGNGGGLCINLTNAGALVDIIDCSFIGNQSVGYYRYGGIGGGIYIGGSATVNFAGRIEVSGNLSSQQAGGIYVASGAKMNIRKGTQMLVYDNFTSCPTTTQTVTRNGTNYTISVLEQTPQSVASNLHLATALNLLEGDLSPLSEIHLTTAIAAPGKIFSAANNYNTFITPADLAVFHSDTPASLSFRLDTAQNAVFLVVRQTENMQVIAHDLVFPKKPRTLTDDGTHTVPANHFEVLNAPGPFTIQFFATPDGSPVADPNAISAWSATAPRFGATGNHTIYYKVSTIDEFVIGSLNMHILAKFLYIEKAPTASLKYGETLSRATFSDWSVKDDDGNSVAGTWLFSLSTTVPSGVETKYALTFMPYRTNYYEQNPTTSITVSIGFSLVFYKPSAQAGAGGEFYTDAGCTISTSITSIGTMLSHLSDGGSIIFMGTYQIGVTNDLALAQNLPKTFYFIRHSSAIASPIFEVLAGASATFSAQNGRIVFEGAGQYSGTAAAQATAILNRGTLDLRTNVIFRNFNSQGSGETGASGAVITNAATGTLLLNGCEIFGNTARNSVTDGENLGGAVYNAGEMVINSGRFFANTTTGSGGKGGFVFTVGRLLFNGGEIFANTSYLGGGIYVGEEGSVFLNGGELRFNTSTSFGGGVFVAEQGELFLFGSDIYSNRAGSDGGGIFSDGGTIHSQTSGVTGDASTEAALEFIQSQNQSFSTFGEPSTESGSETESRFHPAIFAILLLLMLSLVILNEKSKHKNPFNF